MAHIIPRKAVGAGTGSQSPEPAASAVIDAPPAVIRRKPIDSLNFSNKRVSDISANSNASTPQSAGFNVRTDEPAALRFALGPSGLAAWYDPTCGTASGNNAPAWSAQGMLKKLQIGHDELKVTLEENVLNIQLLETSPGGLTCLLHTDLAGSQQQHCEMPFKSPMTLIGPGKQTYQRCEEAHGNILPWVTTCTVNGVPLEDIQIAFGPDDAYYAYETVKRKVQSKLIIDLQDCLNSRPDELPAHVSMGAGGAWSVFWADKAHEHHIKPNLFPTLCEVLEKQDLPKPKKIVLSPVKHDEFVIEFEDGLFLIRARMQREDVSKLDAYLKRLNGKTKIVVIGTDIKPINRDYICKPFALPASDFSSTPYGDLTKEGHLLPEWREFDDTTYTLMNELGSVAQDSGMCPIM